MCASETDFQQSLSQVRHYQERTKHRLSGYARGPEFLDWENQPDPFRYYADCKRIQLPLIDPDEVQSPSSHDLSRVTALLQYSFGLSAWKEYGPNRWALRCNPSSGNLHPTEAYVIAQNVTGLDDAVYHYAPYLHALEQRSSLTANDTTTPALFISISSIVWREAWKYGERAFRYVQLDSGHALATLRYAAQILGLSLTLVDLEEDTLAALLGIDRREDYSNAEVEIPELLLRVTIKPNDEQIQPESLSPTNWQGKANPLGGEPNHNWPILDIISKASAVRKNDTDVTADKLSQTALSAPLPDQHLPQLILQRRSAQAYRGSTSGITAEAFFSIVEALMPATDKVPFDAWAYPTLVHPVFFVHRVAGLEPGLYALPRHDQALALLKQQLNPEFAWQQPELCPAHLAFYRLQSGDCRKAARAISCHQEIASASSFSLGMLSEFDRALEEYGPKGFRLLYQEAGLLGQVLYLHAEHIGKRGTGIGCFFDDEFHQLLGIQGTAFQDVYHFTVGDPIDDSRLQTLPPYQHLESLRDSGSSDELEQMAQLKQAIAEHYAQREALKKQLEQGQIKTREGLKQLDEIDAALSQLDSTYKKLWDKHHR